MTDLSATPRLSLPLLATAQAQKEVTHNEALVLIDALVQMAVVDGPQSDPPAAPTPGDAWLVGAAATGAWAGQDMTIAIWTAGGWRFVVPRAGMRAARLSDGVMLRFAAGLWVAPDSVAVPVGGGTVDDEARAAIAAVILALAAQGLMIPS
ncbi:DUF2793 domain-containing protein [Sphingopyxis sp. XHP0097]|jgi:hypothetical protein|uniref:DUF2793 domain-containing protein n=1 Tax=Sphingopyxis jiangsuensis TaxID=2871171 RepID=A0ABS7MA28_9SPHN|nr:DUF2793 domain-containing protein [Sphingopyxis jiangsuensis]MBY4635658.1 DUF2793 domain-containing protein [Sphingopyxis jiangsuensis]